MSVTRQSVFAIRATRPPLPGPRYNAAEPVTAPARSNRSTRGYICSRSRALFFPARAGLVRANYARGKETRLALGPLPDYIYLNVPITPVKSPIGTAAIEPAAILGYGICR